MLTSSIPDHLFDQGTVMLRRALCLLMVILAILLLAILPARSQAAGSSSMPGMKMDADTTDMLAADANEQMSGMLMDSPHMKMTPLEAPKPGDSARADSIVKQLRAALARYEDYNVALADGFRIFLPKVPQKVYHFSNLHSAVYSAFTFDPARPTSLLYRKTADGYKLVGAMYTAPAREDLAQLNARVPLSVTQWHEHVNLCVPPRDQIKRMTETQDGKLLFGTKGSIATQEACTAAGGRFYPRLFGWMVHVNPWETDPKLVWGTHEHGHEE
jgi:hypothetical protein